MEMCQGPRAETKRPRLAVPPGACDCHMHIFGPPARYPYAVDRGYTPPNALEPAYLKMSGRLGLERMVVVQASVYGCDNTRTVAAVADFGQHRARGIGMIEQGTSRQEIRRLAEAGIRGTRFITTIKGGPTLEHLPGVAKEIAEFGWHIEMYVPRNLWSDLLPVIARLPVPVVFDHMGGMLANTDPNDPDFVGMLKLLESGRCWVKLCGYRASLTGHPYADVEPLAKRFVKHAPERCVWGTDWPHTTLTGYMPDDGDLLDLLGTWAPDAAVRQRILVENAAALYGFA